MSKKIKQPLINTLFKEVKSTKNRVKINSPEDLANTMASLIPFINSNQILASLFVADIDAFMDDMGIELSKEMRKHLTDNVPLYKYNDKKIYNAMKSGKRLSGLNYLRLVPSKELMLKTNLSKQIKALKDSKKAIPPIEHMLPLTLRNLYSCPLMASSKLFTTTRGWTVVYQIAQSYMSDLFEDIMETQFNSAVLAALITGQREFEGIAEPWHDFDFWFLCPIHLRLTIEYLNIENEPSMSLQGTGPRHVNVKFKINGKLIIDGTTGAQTTTFSGTAIKRGAIVRREKERDYIIDFRPVWPPEWPSIMLDGDNTGILRDFVAYGMDDYFEREIPIMPLFSLKDTPPFIFFDSSDVVSVDGPDNQNALTWTFGDGPNRVSTFDRYIILPGNNITIGNSAAAIHFSIRKGLPELPMISEEDKNLVVNTIDVELRDGYIEVTGNGVYHTCSCYDDVHFSYSIKIRLSIDAEGNLVGTADDPDVDLSVWQYLLHTLLLGALGFIVVGPVGGAVGAGLGLIGTAIAESMFGSEVADAIEDQLNIDINVEQQLNEGLSNLAQTTNGLILISARMRTIQITQNGLFFHGNLTTNAILSPE